MSKLFRDCLNIAYRGVLPDNILNKAILKDQEKEMADKDIEIALLEKKFEKIQEQVREQALHNEGLQKDKI